LLGVVCGAGADQLGAIRSLSSVLDKAYEMGKLVESVSYSSIRKSMRCKELA